MIRRFAPARPRLYAWLVSRNLSAPPGAPIILSHRLRRLPATAAAVVLSVSTGRRGFADPLENSIDGRLGRRVIVRTGAAAPDAMEDGKRGGRGDAG